MPSFIPATGRTQHVAGVCLNRIGKVYSCARVGAALAMKVEDVFTQNRRLWVRLREKGGKAHAMPCHHNLEVCDHAQGNPRALMNIAAEAVAAEREAHQIDDPICGNTDRIDVTAEVWVRVTSDGTDADASGKVGRIGRRRAAPARLSPSPSRHGVLAMTLAFADSTGRRVRRGPFSLISSIGVTKRGLN